MGVNIEYFKDVFNQIPNKELVEIKNILDKEMEKRREETQKGY